MTDEFKSGGSVPLPTELRIAEVGGKERIFPLGLLRQIFDMGLLGAATMCGLMDATDEEFNAIVQEWQRKQSDPPLDS
jgi:hypothetical protein